MSEIDVSKMSQEELRQLRNRVVNEIYHLCPEKRQAYRDYQNAYQKKWREDHLQDEEYRKKHNERSREWLKKKYAEDEEYRERQKELARQRYYRRKERKQQELEQAQQTI
jgi:hypothetical protein